MGWWVVRVQMGVECGLDCWEGGGFIVARMNLRGNSCIAN